MSTGTMPSPIATEGGDKKGKRPLSSFKPML